MKRWIRWAALLYPAEWRIRYGAEFDALLDDAGLRWGDLTDVARGAAIMQMTSFNNYWKVAALAGIAGGILAAGISFTIPDQYDCRASLELKSSFDASGKPTMIAGQIEQAMQEFQLEALGRDHLIRIMHDPAFNLYPKERSRLPVEYIALDIFQKHLRLFPTEHRGSVEAFTISFEYPDPEKARAVVQQLIADFMNWTILQQHSGSFPGRFTVRVLDAPLRPQRPIYPLRGNIALFGAFAGMLTGSLFLMLWRRTRKYAVFHISLAEDIRPFVASQVSSGTYRDADEYICALIRADEEKHK